MIQKSRLRNGLLVLTESMPHVRSVSLGVWLKRGSRHEPPSLNGACHFIEHLVFKGTETRTARDIALLMDSLGGQMDAFTTKEYTCFYTRVLDRHVDTALEVLADIVRHPRFDPEEVERERQVILEEIRMVEDSPEELLYDVFANHFYPRHPLGRPIQGTEQTLKALGRRRVLSFFRRLYRPENLLIVASGRVRHEDVVARVRRLFGPMERGDGRSARSGPPRAHGGIVRKRKKELEQLHLMLGLPSYPEDFEERYTLFVLNTLLGGTMSSRLFQKIREERGLVYSVYSAVNTFQDSGFLMVYAACTASRGREVVKLVLQEMADLRERGPGEDELEVAKEHLKGSLMLSLESTSSRMSQAARQEMYYHRHIGPPEILQKLDAVDASRVHRMARNLFASPTLALAAVGRVQEFRLRPRDLAL